MLQDYNDHRKIKKKEWILTLKNISNVMDFIFKYKYPCETNLFRKLYCQIGTESVHSNWQVLKMPEIF